MLFIDWPSLSRDICLHLSWPSYEDRPWGLSEGEEALMTGGEMSWTEMKIKSSLIPPQPDRRWRSQFRWCASERRRLADVMVSDKDGGTRRVRMGDWRERLCEINPRLFHASLLYSGCTAQLVSMFSSLDFKRIFFSFLQIKIPNSFGTLCELNLLKKEHPSKAESLTSKHGVTFSALWAKTAVDWGVFLTSSW